VCVNEPKVFCLRSSLSLCSSSGLVGTRHAHALSTIYPSVGNVVLGQVNDLEGTEGGP
jgi:hypothetical protein